MGREPPLVRVRVALIGRLRSAHTSLRRTDDGLELEFPNRPDVDVDVRRFAIEEKRCCAFWGFAVHTGADAVVLQWDGPPSVSTILDQLAAYFAGDGDLDVRIAGLL